MPVMPPLSTYEVGGPSTATVEGHSLTLLAHEVPMPLSVIEDLCTRIGNLEYSHGQLVKKVITVSDVEVADGIAIGEIGPSVSAVEGEVQVLASQMIQAVSRLEQVGVRVEQGQIEIYRFRSLEASGFGFRDEQQREYFDAVHSWDG
ncbi:hypothetical protein Tco_1171859 [Tanacetum coccineum]